LLRQEVLLCRQATYLFEGTIEENFKNFYRYRALPAPCNAEMGDFLSTCAINFNLDANCDLMSGGERHRIYLAICLSLAREKGVLLLDEPTGALDDATSEKVLSNIVAYCREKEISLVIVSHNEALIESFADDRIHLQSTAQKKSGS
jgi:putative ABC transport system ATP-binding protein